MGLVIDGQIEEVPGLRCESWHDDKRLRLVKGEDYRTRSTKWVRQVVLHTTKGLPSKAGDPTQRILTGIGQPVDAGLRCARLWSTDGRTGGAHLAVDFDGTVSCMADLLTEAAQHANQCNTFSVGVEIMQNADASMYLGQLDAVVVLVDYLTRRFGIQRQLPHRYNGAPLQRMILGGSDCVGVFGHRDISHNRGAGDPGSAIFDRLQLAGYEAFDFDAQADLAAWKMRQASHNISPADGVVGPASVLMLKSAGVPHGMWVRRPGDVGGRELVA